MKRVNCMILIYKNINKYMDQIPYGEPIPYSEQILQVCLSEQYYKCLSCLPHFYYDMLRIRAT